MTLSHIVFPLGQSGHEPRQPASPVITAEQARSIRNTRGLVTDNEWADDLAVPVERIRSLRKTNRQLN